MATVAACLLIGVLAGYGASEPLDASEVTVQATEMRTVETVGEETVIRGRPFVPHRRIATVARGTKLVVRGVTPSRDERGCRGADWYAVHPFGFVCSRHVRASEGPPDLALTPALAPGRRLPYQYARVHGSNVPVYATVADIEEGLPQGLLTKGMSLAVSRTSTIGHIKYVQTIAGKWVPRDEVRWIGDGSEWAGVRIEGHHVGPSFGWVSKDKTAVRSQPDRSAALVRKVKRRQRVPLFESKLDGKKTRWVRIGRGQWVLAKRVNEVRFIEPPAGVLGDADPSTTWPRQWIDVDLGEQVLVAYRGRTPRFATLVSSGRKVPTPKGNYPVWAKVVTMKMGNQAYEDQAYLVEGVPWVLLFQGHNALHAAYWHDSFGIRKSHGCVNLSPRDARWMFNWALPAMPTGWTGYLPTLKRSVVVHVRDSHKKGEEAFLQERAVGPPDREAERKMLEEAQLRRGEESGSEGDSDSVDLDTILTDTKKSGVSPRDRFGVGTPKAAKDEPSANEPPAASEDRQEPQNL